MAGLLRLLIAVALLLLTATRGSAVAAEPSKWEFDVEPYGWLFGNFGAATVDGHEVKVDVSPIDTYQLLEDGNAFAAAGYFAARYDRWIAFADSIGGYAEEGVHEQIPTQLCSLSVAAKMKLKFAFADFGLGYQLGRWSLPNRRRPFTFDVYTGTRYMWFSAKVNASGQLGAVQRSAKAESSWSWADPLIGVRWAAPLFDPVSLDFRADIGGFGASSHLVWGLASDVRIWLPWSPWSLHPWLALGYRVLDFDRSGSSNDSINLQFRGPTSGAGVTF